MKLLHSSQAHFTRTVRRIILAVACLGMASWGAAAEARYTRAFFECLTTPLVNFDGTIVDAAVATPELSTLVFAVQEAGLAEALTAPGLTVFAPTNDAFAAIPEEILNAVLPNTDVLTAVLTYHVVPGEVDPRRFVSKRKLETVLGQKFF